MFLTTQSVNKISQNLYLKHWIRFIYWKESKEWKIPPWATSLVCLEEKELWQVELCERSRKLWHVVEISTARNTLASQRTENDSCELKIDLLSSSIKYPPYIMYNFINNIKSPLSLELLSKPFLIQNICCTIFLQQRKNDGSALVSSWRSLSGFNSGSSTLYLEAIDWMKQVPTSFIWASFWNIYHELWILLISNYM